MKLTTTIIATLAAATFAQDTIMSMPHELPHFVEEPRQLGMTPVQGADLAVSAISIGQSILPAITGNGKKCHQMACWIATPTEACGMVAANKVQRELMRGRNAYTIDGVGPTGMWARYWRTMFWPPDRGDIAKGICSDNSTFVVTNCQGTGKVYC